MKTIYLGLGSNLGNREENLQTAVDYIAKAGVTVVRASSVYETKPMYVADQGLFLNMVLEGRTDGFPRMLLRRLQQIERAMGRKRIVDKGPRNIDIDILLFGKFVVTAAELIVPHPRMAERQFVLAPLSELTPDLRHPVLRKSMREMLRAVPEQGIRKVDFTVTLPAHSNE